MMIKCIISWSYYIHNMMKIFWMLNSICFKLYWWLTLYPKFIESPLCCFINMEEQMLQLNISYHTFLCFFQPIPLWYWLMGTRYMTKELGLFYVTFLTVWLYIQVDQFIIIEVNFPTLDHQVPSNSIFVLKGYIWGMWRIDGGRR